MFQWCESRRFDIAGLMSSVLRAHMQAYDPVFSMTLRYLIRFFLHFLLSSCPPPIIDQLIKISLNLKFKFLYYSLPFLAAYIKVFAFVKACCLPYQISLRGCF